MSDKDTECLKSLIEWAYEDVKQVLLLVGFELATLAIIVSSKFFGSEQAFTLTLACIAGAILCSAGLYTCYVHKTHMAARSLIDNMHKGDFEGGMALMATVWTKNRYFYIEGHALGVLALVALFIYAFLQKGITTN